MDSPLVISIVRKREEKRRDLLPRSAYRLSMILENHSFPAIITPMTPCRLSRGCRFHVGRVARCIRIVRAVGPSRPLQRARGLDMGQNPAERGRRGFPEFETAQAYLCAADRCYIRLCEPEELAGC